MWIHTYVHDYISLILVRMRNVLDKSGENHKKHSHLTHFFFENLVVNEIMWTNMVQPDRPQMTI